MPEIRLIRIIVMRSQFYIRTGPIRMHEMRKCSNIVEANSNDRDVGTFLISGMEIIRMPENVGSVPNIEDGQQFGSRDVGTFLISETGANRLPEMRANSNK